MGERIVLILVFFLLAFFVGIYFINQGFPEMNTGLVTGSGIHERGDSFQEHTYYHAIVLGGQWFLNNQNEEFIYYQYNPFDKIHPDTNQRLREMGSLWSISVLSNLLTDPRYDVLAQKGFRFFENYFEYNEKHDFYYVSITPEKLKLGYLAFAILTLLEIDHPQKEAYLEKFTNGIAYLQNEDGELRTFLYSDRNTGTDYYPGEALFALMSLYEYNGNEKAFEITEKAFPYYVRYFENDPNTAFIPWQTRAWYKMYKATKEKKYADFVFKMNDFMIKDYDYDGDCYAYDFTSSVTAVHMEGVTFAYDLAKKFKDEKRYQCYAQFIREGADFMLSLQITNTEDYEKEAIGGFLGSPTSESMRVDRNQHAVIALSEAIQYGIIG